MVLQILLLMLRLLLPCLLLAASQLYAQQTPVTKANYQLAARFSPKKLEKMIFRTQVDPHWLKHSDRFWYVYETTEGKKWYIVDPLKQEKRPMFDNDKLAAAISRLVKDPFDSKHLGLDSLKFIRDENWIQFEVKSTQDADIKKQDTAAKKKSTTPQKPEKKIFYFEYNLVDGTLNELKDFSKPKHK